MLALNQCEPIHWSTLTAGHELGLSINRPDVAWLTLFLLLAVQKEHWWSVITLDLLIWQISHV